MVEDQAEIQFNTTLKRSQQVPFSESYKHLGANMAACESNNLEAAGRCNQAVSELKLFERTRHHQAQGLRRSTAWRSEGRLCCAHLKDVFCTLSQSYESHETSDVVTERYYYTHKETPAQTARNKHLQTHWTEEGVLRFLCPHPLSAALVNGLPITSVIAGGFGLCLLARLAVGSIACSGFHFEQCLSRSQNCCTTSTCGTLVGMRRHQHMCHSSKAGLPQSCHFAVFVNPVVWSSTDQFLTLCTNVCRRQHACSADMSGWPYRRRAAVHNAERGQLLRKVHIFLCKCTAHSMSPNIP